MVASQDSEGLPVRRHACAQRVRARLAASVWSPGPAQKFGPPSGSPLPLTLPIISEDLREVLVPREPPPTPAGRGEHGFLLPASFGRMPSLVRIRPPARFRWPPTRRGATASRSRSAPVPSVEWRSSQTIGRRAPRRRRTSVPPRPVAPNPRFRLSTPRRCAPIAAPATGFALTQLSLVSIPRPPPPFAAARCEQCIELRNTSLGAFASRYETSVPLVSRKRLVGQPHFFRR